jgi:hypothetical protein
LLLGRIATVAWPPLGIPAGLPPIMEDGMDLDPSVLLEERDLGAMATRHRGQALGN